MMQPPKSAGFGAREPWCLRYASHLGYRSPEAPLFPLSAAGRGPLEQVDFAADLGFAGVQYALALGSSLVEQSAVAARLERHGLATGCMVYAPFEVIRKPHLGQPGPAVRAEFLQQIHRALEVARRIKARQVVVLASADSEILPNVQRAALVEHLRYAADLAHDAGVTLELECVASAALPPMILARLDDVLEAIQQIGSPNVRMIYDTAHIQALEGDAVLHFRRAFEHVDVLQIADYPGRFEPGTGAIDFETILTEAARRQFRGLVELEHSWSGQGAQGERDGLEAYRRLDARIRGNLAQLVADAPAPS